VPLIEISKLPPETRQYIARRSGLPEGLIGILAKDEDWRVRCTVAMRPDPPKEVIEALTEDEDSAVRSAARGALARMQGSRSIIGEGGRWYLDT
jgi:uncharacterized protein (DUF2336 family)